MATLDEPGWTANSSDGTIGAARTSRGVRMCNNCNYAERLFKPFTVDLVLFFKDTSAVLILFSFCRYHSPLLYLLATSLQEYSEPYLVGLDSLYDYETPRTQVQSNHLLSY